MDIICVTNRKLCGDFLKRVEEIAASEVKYIILREKDLSEDEYKSLAEKVIKICRKYDKKLLCNTFYNVAGEIGADGVQLPLAIAEKCSVKTGIKGISAHSVDDAKRAEKLGADYITYGHIFATDCKKGLPPRGLAALKEVCRKTHLPVYAIGGITPANVSDTIASGAKGICLMSSLMQCDDVDKLINEFKKREL